jgi:hypothetical protein|tara:strand:+ start:1549 stop:2163 length:615 start_codon:yes stop_codon:yes gene_type:complete
MDRLDMQIEDYDRLKGPDHLYQLKGGDENRKLIMGFSDVEVVRLQNVFPKALIVDLWVMIAMCNELEYHKPVKLERDLKVLSQLIQKLSYESEVVLNFRVSAAVGRPGVDILKELGKACDELVIENTDKIDDRKKGEGRKRVSRRRETISQNLWYIFTHYKVSHRVLSGYIFDIIADHITSENLDSGRLRVGVIELLKKDRLLP